MGRQRAEHIAGGHTREQKQPAERVEKENGQMQLLEEHKVSSERGFLALKAVVAHSKAHYQQWLWRQQLQPRAGHEQKTQKRRPKWEQKGWKRVSWLRVLGLG